MMQVVCFHKPDFYGMGRAMFTWVREQIPVDVLHSTDLIDMLESQQSQI